MAEFVHSLKSGSRRSSEGVVATHASSNARNFFLALIPTFLVHSPSFFQIVSLLSHCVGLG